MCDWCWSYHHPSERCPTRWYSRSTAVQSEKAVGANVVRIMSDAVSDVQKTVRKIEQYIDSDRENVIVISDHLVDKVTKPMVLKIADLEQTLSEKMQRLELSLKKNTEKLERHISHITVGVEKLIVKSSEDIAKALTAKVVEHRQQSEWGLAELSDQINEMHGELKSDFLRISDLNHDHFTKVISDKFARVSTRYDQLLRNDAEIMSEIHKNLHCYMHKEHMPKVSRPTSSMRSPSASMSTPRV